MLACLGEELGRLEDAPRLLQRLRTSVEAETPKALDPALGVLSGALSLLGSAVAVPLLGIAGSVVGVSKAAHGLLQARGGVNPLVLIPRMLRAAARERPLVLLIDDADKIEGEWWSEMLKDLASEIADGLPLFMVMTVDGPRRLDGPEQAEYEWLRGARRLVSADAAEWTPVAPLTGDDVADWIGAVSDDAVRRLLGLTGGLATVTSELWVDWTSEGIVMQQADSDRWVLAANDRDHVAPSAGDVVRRRLQAALPDDRAAGVRPPGARYRGVRG